MLNHLITINNLWPTLKQYGITDKDMTFIKELILGPPEGAEGEGWRYVGRPVEKSFLYEVQCWGVVVGNVHIFTVQYPIYFVIHCLPSSPFSLGSS